MPVNKVDRARVRRNEFPSISCGTYFCYEPAKYNIGGTDAVRELWQFYCEECMINIIESIIMDIPELQEKMLQSLGMLDFDAWQKERQEMLREEAFRLGIEAGQKEAEEEIQRLTDTINKLLEQQNKAEMEQVGDATDAEEIMLKRRAMNTIARALGDLAPEWEGYTNTLLAQARGQKPGSKSGNKGGTRAKGKG